MMHGGPMMDSSHMSWMMGGMGLFIFLAVAVLVLAIFGLLRYLRD
jgi:heme exporter protein D